MEVGSIRYYIDDGKMCFFFFSKYPYRPGQPNSEYTMWKFRDFLGTLILNEINFGHFEAPITTNLTIWFLNSSEFSIFGNVWHFKCEFFPKNKIQSPKIAKRQFLTFWNPPELISRKIRAAVKLLNFHTVAYSQSKIPMRLLRSVGKYIFWEGFSKGKKESLKTPSRLISLLCGRKLHQTSI